jgi:hypothetical protein
MGKRRVVGAENRPVERRFLRHAADPLTEHEALDPAAGLPGHGACESHGRSTAGSNCYPVVFRHYHDAHINRSSQITLAS